MLTQRQHQLLLFIHGYLRDHGVPPSFEEMREALRLKSKSGIHRLITGLEERGYIRRLPYRARALEVTRLPQLARRGRRAGAAPKPMWFGRLRRPRPDRRRSDGALAACRSTAGSPPARRSRRCATTRPRSRCRRTCSATATTTRSRWSANSMIEAGIQDGDIVVIERRDIADNGDIVVALIDEAEVTLKRMRCRGETDRARGRQSAVRDPDLRSQPGQGAGPPGRPDAPLLERRPSVGPPAAPDAG